jgi:AAR2 protein.
MRRNKRLCGIKANLSAIWQSGGLFRYRSRISSTAAGGREEDRDLDNEDSEKEGRNDWIGLTNTISPQLLSRILGDPEIDVDWKPRWTVTSGSTAPRDADQIPGLTSKEAAAGGIAAEQEKELRFLPVDLKRTWREGAIGRERTEAAQDRSWALGDLVRRFSEDGDEQIGERQILGELQFTFLMVLTLMNYSCFEQWKRLLALVLTCRAAITAREGFFTDVLLLLRLQLKRCDDVEGGLFEMDGDDGAEFLKKLLTGFKRAVDELNEGVGFAVKFELGMFEKWVREEFNWELRREAIVRRGMLELEDGEQVEMEINDADEEDETGEYAPVIVDLGDGEGNPSLEVGMKDNE